MRRLALLLALAGCPRSPHVSEMPAAGTVDRPWCVDIEQRDLGLWLACAKTEADCERGRSRGQSIGGLAGVVAISECWYRP